MPVAYEVKSASDGVWRSLFPEWSAEKKQVDLLLLTQFTDGDERLSRPHSQSVGNSNTLRRRSPRPWALVTVT